jgi:hypothetical protein
MNYDEGVLRRVLHEPIWHAEAPQVPPDEIEVLLIQVLESAAGQLRSSSRVDLELV